MTAATKPRPCFSGGNAVWLWHAADSLAQLHPVTANPNPVTVVPRPMRWFPMPSDHSFDVMTANPHMSGEGRGSKSEIEESVENF
jgi:hypothetical protein